MKRTFSLVWITAALLVATLLTACSDSNKYYIGPRNTGSPMDAVNTGLPKVSLETPAGKAVTSKEEWMAGATLTIYDADGTVTYQGTTQVRGRGNSTWGYPKKPYALKFTDGKISSKSGIHGDATVYQISVPIQPGNSGGPLFDTKGNLVGITSSCLNRDYFKSENVNYAIKSSYLKALVDKMPRSIHLQDKADIADYPLTEKIKKFQSYMTYIKVK